MSTYSEIAVLDVVLALIFCVFWFLAFWFLGCTEEQQDELKDKSHEHNTCKEDS